MLSGTSGIIISGVLLILSMVCFTFMSYRGFGMVLTGLAATCIIALGSTDGFMTAMFTTFTNGMGSFVPRMAMSVIFGMIYGLILQASGATDAIGKFFVKRFGTKAAPYVVFVLSIIFALAGVPGAVFIMGPMSFALMKPSGLPNYVGLVAYLGGTYVTVYGLAGVPHNMNIMPTTFLGTDIYAGMPISYVAVPVGIIASLVVITVMTRKCRKNNIGFDLEGLYGVKMDDNTEKPTPSVVLSLLPVVVMLALCFVFIKGFGLSSVAGASIAQAIAVVMLIIFNFKYFEGGAKGILNTLINACTRSTGFLIGCACLTGFGAVVATTPFFNWIVTALLGINISPYFMALIAVAVITLITADAPSGIIMSCTQVFPSILKMPGVNVGALHRIAVMGASTIGEMPWCGAVLQYLECFGYNHKTGYKYVLIGAMCIPTLMAIAGTIVAALIY